MPTEFVRGPEGFSVVFDSSHDAMSTDSGITKDIRRITIGKGDACTTEGEMYIRIKGDPSMVAVSELSFNTTFVTAIAFADLSAGLERSGCEGQSGQGEVVLILLMDCDMPDHTLARAGITVTEGITAVIQDLGLSYRGISASGATMQTIVTVRANGAAPYLRGAGKHTKLGELIGKSTKEAVRQSASANGIDIRSRMSLTEMMERCGYDQEKIFLLSESCSYSEFIDKVMDKDADPRMLALVSSIIHIANEIEWGLVPEDTGYEAGIGLIRLFREPVRSGSLMDTLALNLAKYMVDK